MECYISKSRLGLASSSPRELLWYLRTATHSKTDYEENPLWVPKLRGLANPELTPSRMGPVLLGSNPTRDHRSQQGGEVVPTAPHHAMEVTLDSTLLLVNHG